MNKQQTTQDRHDSDSSDALSSNGFEEAPLSLDAHVAADSATEPQSLETHTSSDAIISAESTTSPPPPIETEVITLEERMRRLEQALAELSATKTPVAAQATIPVAKLVTEMPMRAPPRREPFAPTGVPSIGRRAWLLWELYAEARIIVRMYVDPRYYMSWIGRFLPLCLFVLFLTSAWWNPLAYIPLLGSYLDKATDLIVCFVLFKVLGHEARRYRETSPDLPPSLRL